MKISELRRKLVVLLTIFSVVFSFAQTDCELRWSRFTKDIDATTDIGKTLVTAIDENPEIISSWWVFDTVGEDVLRTNLDELSFVTTHLKAKNKTAEVIVDEIKNAGSYSKWKSLVNTESIFKQVTKNIAKQELPEDFVNVLKKMDFTEDEILEYFVKYHNDHDFRFFNEIGDLMNQYPKLNKTDVNLLWGYTTNLFYRRMNGWLRWGENISKTNEIKNLFNNTLSKLSTFKGTNVYRGIEIDSKGLSDFLNSYKKGSKPVWNDFTSAGSSKTASFADRPEVNVLFDIKHLDAKDISDFADGIKFRGNPKSEVLIKSGSQFEVIKPPYLNKDKKWVIELIQIQ